MRLSGGQTDQNRGKLGLSVKLLAARPGPRVGAKPTYHSGWRLGIVMTPSRHLARDTLKDLIISIFLAVAIVTTAGLDRGTLWYRPL